MLPALHYAVRMVCFAVWEDHFALSALLSLTPKVPTLNKPTTSLCYCKPKVTPDAKGLVDGNS